MVSAIIPARNEEANIARVVESVAAQPEVGEIIVVDDQSTDATPRILAQLGARLPQLRIVQAGELPTGWVGKNHAVAVGAAVARGEWMLITDADTFHLPGSVARALGDTAAHQASVLSYSPEQITPTFWERSLIPFVFCRLDAMFPYHRVNDPNLPDAALNGQYIFVRRDAYEAVGGHTAIAGEILEDVALARLLKKNGYRIFFDAPHGVVRTRMYCTFAAMWEGWTKNFYRLIVAIRGSVWKELAGLYWWTPLLLLPLANLWLPWAPRLPFALAVLAAALLAGHISYGWALSRNLLPVSNVKYYIPGLALYSAVVVTSWWKSTRGNVSWKGRTYRVGDSPGLP